MNSTTSYIVTLTVTAVHAIELLLTLFVTFIQFNRVFISYS